jgi:transcriptional regulator with XRE-family HTH domain
MQTGEENQMPYGYGVMISERRIAKGITIEHLASQLVVHRITLKRFENEDYPPPPELTEKLQSILGLTEDFTIICERARLDRSSNYKRVWDFAHQHEHVGTVWIRIRPSSKTREQPHNYKIFTYGDRGLHHAMCKGTIIFSDVIDTLCLIHRKFLHGDLHVTLVIEPAAEVIFGDTKAPCTNVIVTENWVTKSKGRFLLEILREPGY